MKTLMIATSLTLAFAGSGAAETYRASNWMEANHPVSTVGFDVWAEEIARLTDGRVVFEVFQGGALIPPKSTMQGVADGLAQVGFHAANYTPSLLPIVASLGGFGFSTPDPYVLSAAYADFSMNDPEAKAEWIQSGVLYGAGYGTPLNHFLCSKEVRTTADFKGLRVRAPGGASSRFVETVGAISVNIPSTEAYQAFERGSLDCSVFDTTHLTGGATLIEVTKGVTLLNMTPAYTGGLHIFDLDFWNSLDEEDRRILLDSEAWVTARTNISMQQFADAALEAARKAGIAVIEPDESLKAAMADWVASGTGDLEEAEQMGVADARAVFDRFQTYIDKWKPIFAGMQDRMDPDEYARILRENLYDKIDVATYGR